MLRQNVDAWATFVDDMRSIFPGIDVWIDFNENTDEHIEASVQLSDTTWLPMDAAGTSVLQASQILAYISLFKPRILILDEPDSHLHPNNQRALCDLIARLSEERGFQALISTHSRHVLDSMKDRSVVVWLSKGQVVDEPDINTTEVLLDLGALDSVDYFANGSLKCVVATEDTNQDPIKALLWSNGFVEEDTEIASYAGCSKADAAVVLGRFLQDKASHVTFVVHRDRDYMGATSAEKFAKRLDQAGVQAFLTEPSDVEGYFVNAEHLNHLNPTITVDRIQELIAESTLDAREESIMTIVNQRVAAEFAELRGTGRSPDHGRIAVDAAKDYDAKPSDMRRGKKVLGRLVAKIQADIKMHPTIFSASPHLKSAPLRAMATKLWPSTSMIPVHPSAAE